VRPTETDAAKAPPSISPSASQATLAAN